MGSERLPGSPQAQVESLVSLLIIGWRQPMGRLSMKSVTGLTGRSGHHGSIMLSAVRGPKGVHMRQLLKCSDV